LSRTGASQSKEKSNPASKTTGAVPEPTELLCRKQGNAQRKPTTARVHERTTARVHEREIARRQKRPSTERASRDQALNHGCKTQNQIKHLRRQNPRAGNTSASGSRPKNPKWPAPGSSLEWDLSSALHERDFLSHEQETNS
jgi:hypothetical protein